MTPPPHPSDITTTERRIKNKKRLYAGFPRRFEKHCVVIGPLDPNCFEGGYPSPRSPPEGLNGVLRDLKNLKNKRRPLDVVGSRLAGVGKRASEKQRYNEEEEEEVGPRPFVRPPRPFAMDSPAYQARAWDMWEPGGAGSGLRGGLGGNRMMIGNTLGKAAGNSYVVLFDYGSVIFMHFTQQQQEVKNKRKRGREREKYVSA